MERFQRMQVVAQNENPDVAVTRATTLALDNRASLISMDVLKPIPKALGLVTNMAVTVISNVNCSRLVFKPDGFVSLVPI